MPQLIFRSPSQQAAAMMAVAAVVPIAAADAHAVEEVVSVGELDGVARRREDLEEINLVEVWQSEENKEMRSPPVGTGW